MAIGSRILCLLILVASLTGCLDVGARDVSQGAVLPLASPSLSFGAQVLPFDHDGGIPATSGVSDGGSSSVFLLLPAGNELSASSIRLSKNGDGSVSVQSGGRPISLLRGLDPALVNPALLPFLFPSCDVPVLPAR